MNFNFSTKENDFNLSSYVERLKKLRFKIQLDEQQLKKAIKMYGNDINENKKG
mgnify:CR=1 FL=1